MQNRIRELREAAGLSLQELADRISQITGEPANRSQLSRLELGKRKLTVNWMRVIAAALNRDPSELLHTAALARVRTEVVDPPADLAPLARMAEVFGGRLYRVMRSAVPACGILDGDLILVKPGEPKPLDLVLAKFDEDLVVRQFVPPALLITNQAGENPGVRLDDRSVRVVIIGIVEKFLQ